MLDQITQLYKKYKNPILLVSVLLIAAVAYFTVFYEPSPEPLSRTQVTGANGGQNTELLQLLLEVRSIQLDDNIFFDPAFAELDSTVQEIPEQPTGRDNPFAPLGVESAGNTQ